MQETLRCVAFLGRHARMNWLEVELDFPPRPLLHRHTMIVSNHFDMDKMRGDRGEAF
jgi:hypothetical protein